MNRLVKVRRMRLQHTAAIGLLALLFTLFVSPEATAQDSLIVGGERAGPYRLGMPFQQVTERLGAPTSIVPSDQAEGTSTRIYKAQKLAFLVDAQGKVLGITVASPGWKTDRGFGIGAPVVAFEETFGRGLKRGPQGLAYPKHGLSISFEDGLVHTIYIVKKDQVQAGRGDHLLIGGLRAGEIRLGSSEADLRQLLGAPAQTQGAQQEIWLYPNLGVRLAFVNGRLHLIGISSGDWITPNGLKVGRPFQEMKRELGDGYRVRESSVFYDRWGLGARLQGEQILELLIFSTEQPAGRG